MRKFFCSFVDPILNRICHPGRQNGVIVVMLFTKKRKSMTFNSKSDFLSYFKSSQVNVYRKNTTPVSFDIKCIRRDQKQRRNGEAYVFLVEPNKLDI